MAVAKNPVTADGGLVTKKAPAFAEAFTQYRDKFTSRWAANYLFCFVIMVFMFDLLKRSNIIAIAKNNDGDLDRFIIFQEIKNNTC